jgi:hypothetical protein
VCNRDVCFTPAKARRSACTSELAGNQLHLFVGCLVIGTGSKRLLRGDDGASGFVNPQKRPSGWLFVVSPAANLPGSHDGVVFPGEPDGMNLDQPGIAIISEFKNVP